MVLGALRLHAQRLLAKPEPVSLLVGLTGLEQPRAAQRGARAARRRALPARHAACKPPKPARCGRRGHLTERKSAGAGQAPEQRRMAQRETVWGGRVVKGAHTERPFSSIPGRSDPDAFYSHHEKNNNRWRNFSPP
eukprot:2621528-Prymnesium_polylepis.1